MNLSCFRRWLLRIVEILTRLTNTNCLRRTSYNVKPEPSATSKSTVMKRINPVLFGSFRSTHLPSLSFSLFLWIVKIQSFTTFCVGKLQSIKSSPEIFASSSNRQAFLDALWTQPSTLIKPPLWALSRCFANPSSTHLLQTWLNLYKQAVHIAQSKYN